MASDVKYTVGDWPEKGRGNHRAIVRVGEPGPAVLAHIQWRRRDRSPEKKAVLVFQPGSSQPVPDVAAPVVTRESGDIVFRAEVAGDYEVYYLPYNPGVSNFDDPGTYFAPRDTASAAWKAPLQLADTGPEAAWRNLPHADLVTIQARGQFHRMDPMEVVATEAEVAGLARAHPAPYLLFPEDRSRAIRMPDDLPLDWVRRGPSSRFVGTARPGEYYPFQIGVWAVRKGIQRLSLTLPDLTSRSGRKIPASQLECINLAGYDWLGRPIKRTFAVGNGQVRALWIGIQVPADARGEYTGAVTVKPAGMAATVVQVSLKVAGAALADGGVGDLARLSRLKWLNSRLGLDDEVLPPYTPVTVQGETLGCLDRTVRVGATGLPAQVTSRGRQVLAAPMELALETAEGPIRFSGVGARITRRTPGAVDRTATVAAPGVAMASRMRLEADGCVHFDVRVRADRAMDLTDTALEIPFSKQAAPYMMGLGMRGGARPARWDWKWNVDKADNQVWIGDVDCGMQLTLQGDRDAWDVVTLHDAGLPDSWSNGGKGGCTVREEGGRVVLRAFSGPRHLAAGQELRYRFRLLVTPFRRPDPNHWNWRYGDLGGGHTPGANILHIHHAGAENPYINYPFIAVDRLRETVRKARSSSVTSVGSLSYPARGNLDPARGSLHLWARLRFDPTAGGFQQPQFNQPLFYLDWPNEDEVGFYWNVDVRGMRAYLRRGSPTRNEYPAMVDAPSPQWRMGERHLLTLSWGDRLEVYIDGKLMAGGDRVGLLGTGVDGALMNLEGRGFALEAMKISASPFRAGALPVPTADPDTLFLETFAGEPGKRPLPPVRCAAGTVVRTSGKVVVGQADGRREVTMEARSTDGARNGVNLYYTVRELSNHVAEMWPLRSLGDEVFQGRETFVYSVEKSFFGQAGGGYPWLQEHLVSGYVPAWRQPLANGDHDASIGTQGLSRWHNYYVEGMRWLLQNTGIDGLYLDGIGYDREIMKRIAKVMHRANPRSRINFHSGNNYDFMDWHTSPANSYMEHFPYVSNLWFGEMYDYNLGPDYWLVEISGLPFGLTSEMLNYENGGNAYRGMLYGMTGRQHPSVTAMWAFWDSFGIQSAEWIGYWQANCPVRSRRPGVLATVYRRSGRSLIALAHWPQPGEPAGPVAVDLAIDWKALGLSPDRVRMHAPAIKAFQPAAELKVGEPVVIEPGKGMLIVVERVAKR